MTACSHESCSCQIEGCGLDHPADWKPKLTTRINGVQVSGDDLADCMAHYMIQLGYPTDRPDHLRRVAMGTAEKMEARRANARRT